MDNVTGNDLQMLMNADRVSLLIQMEDGSNLYCCTFEYSSLIAQYNDGIIVPFFYHAKKWDDNGDPAGLEEKPTIKVLRIDDFNPKGKRMVNYPQILGEERHAL